MQTDRSSPATLVLVGWVAGLAAAIAACSLVGRGPLAGPPIGRPADWPAWFAAHDPVLAAMAIMRLAVLASCWYLAALTVLATIGRVAGRGWAVAVACAAAPAPARRLLASALGAGIVLAATTPRPMSTPAGPIALIAADAGPSPTRTLRRLDTQAAPPTSTPQTSPVAPDPPPPTVVPPVGSPPTPPPAPTSPETPTAVVTEAPGPAGPDAATPDARVGEWVVRPGEHFWSIAEAHLRATWGREPGLRQVGRYWRSLVAANRDRLADPTNPDLLFPGQRLRLPPPTDSGARR